MSLDQIYLLPAEAQRIALDKPALAPPPGVWPKLDDPPNGNILALSVTTTALSISTIAFLLAAYAKICCIKKVHLEDFLAFAGYGLSVGVFSCDYAIVKNVGFLVHQWNVRIRDLANLFYLVHVIADIYFVAIVLIKTAILLKWVRLFVPRGTRGSFYWACYTLIWTNILFYTIIGITGNVACKPYERLWDPTIPGTCSINREIIYIVNSAYNLLSDLLILLLPQKIIWRLQLKTRKKLGIAFVFLVGVLACISAGFRLSSFIEFRTAEDKTYNICVTGLWTNAELTCGILTFCVPSISKIFKDRGPFGKLVAAFSAWSLSTSRRAKDGNSPHWPSSSNSKPSTFGSTYQQIDENGLPLEHIHLVEVQNRNAQHHPHVYEEDLEPPNAGILRTIRFTATEERSDVTRRTDAPQFQTPWDQNDV